MRVASLAGAGLAGLNSDEGPCILVACFIGAPRSQALERGLDRSEIVEGIEAVSAAAEFTRRLRAAEHQKAEDSRLVAAKVEDSADAVLVLGNTSVANGSDQS
jgi:hypothetical protein